MRSNEATFFWVRLKVCSATAAAAPGTPVPGDPAPASAQHWFPPKLCRCSALTAGASSGPKSKSAATKLGNSFGSQRDVLSCVWTLWTGEKEECPGAYSLGSAERESTSPVPCLLGRGCTLQALVEAFGRCGFNSHMFFSYISSREISKGMWVHEDTETLMCSEDPKYLVLKDAFF